MPVQEPEQAEAFVTKLLDYERQPKTLSAAFFTNMLLGGVEIIRPGDVEMRVTQMFNNNVVPFYTPSESRFYDTMTDFDQSSNGDFDVTANHLSELLNGGYNFFTMWTHGDKATWEMEARPVLFTTAGDYRTMLNMGVIPVGLRQEFQNIGIVLSVDAFIKINNRWWLLVDGNDLYRIKNNNASQDISPLTTTIGDHQTTLVTGIIPEDLRQEFQNNGIPLSFEAKLQVENPWSWIISDGKNAYRLGNIEINPPGTPLVFVQEIVDEHFVTHDAARLVNASVAGVKQGRSGIIYTVACSTAHFDKFDPSLGESFIRNPVGGAVAYIGASRLGWVGTSYDYADEFHRQLFDPSQATSYNIGLAFAAHKFARSSLATMSDNTNRYLQFALNLLGDPSMVVWTAKPRDLTVTHDNLIPLTSGGLNSLIVKVDEPGALVSITQNGKLLGSATSVLGKARVFFDDPVMMSGPLFLTVTKHNYRPYLARPYYGGDLDGDGDVDITDLLKIIQARGFASDRYDVRDVDGDGEITVLDSRKLVSLCTREGCSAQ